MAERPEWIYEEIPAVVFSKGQAVAKHLERVQELVRCKDCKHGYRCKNAAGEDSVECSNHYVSLDSICRNPDWFCADGERKET